PRPPRDLHSSPTRRSSDLAPQEDGGIVAVPPLDQVGPPLQTNRTVLATNIKLLGRALAELQREARAAVIDEARAYLAQAGEPVRSEEHTSELQSRGHLVCR